MDIKQILESAGKDILTEETLNQIQESFTKLVDKTVTERVTLAVESALETQNIDHGTKFKRMINAIDEDHTKKMVRLVEAVEAKRFDQLKKVKDVYESQLVTRAESHKNQFVESISTFLDKFLDKHLPVEQIKEAAKANYLKNVLKEAREILGVDDRVIDENFKNAILDGKRKIDRLTQENTALKNRTVTTESKKLLSEKTKSMPSELAAFVRRRLDGKSPTFIKENLDYVVKLYKENETNQRLSVVSESRSRKPNVDFVGAQDENKIEENVIEESYTDSVMNSYLEGLGANRE